MSDLSVVPEGTSSLRDSIKAALTEIDSTVAQSLQHVMDEAAGLAVAEVVTWLRCICPHDDVHLCDVAADLEARRV